MVWLVAMNGIGLKSWPTPCIYATYAVEIMVDIEIYKLSSLQFKWMISFNESLFIIVPCTDTKGCSLGFNPD